MSIRLEHLFKRFSDHLAVNDVSLEIADGELFVLLGPSGSGKSTVLRMIAGLAGADMGRIVLHGRDVTRIPARRRGVGLVFQHYALFRHLTVTGNVEFALRIRGVRRAERARRRDELLELVGLTGLQDRYPHQLSGGQQQRVAIARALAHRPEVLLLDEPFGALDARIRADLRHALKSIQRELGVTTLFVTHDQDEAFELADRLGVMHLGRLLETGPPMELYLRPETEFVATFLGRANLMVGECDGTAVRLGSVRFPLSTDAIAPPRDRRVQLLFRPEDVAIKDSRDALAWPLLGRAVIANRIDNGSYERLRLRMPKIDGVRPIAPETPFGSDEILIEATRSQHQARRFPLRSGDLAWVGIRRVHALTHPGLHILSIVDVADGPGEVMRLSRRIAQAAHARLTILGLGPDREAAEERLRELRALAGGGLAALETRWSPEPLREAVAALAARTPFDLILCRRPESDLVAIVGDVLETGEHHVLLVAGSPVELNRVLVCVAAGEPAKGDVRFAARLVRHLGAHATVLTVVPRECPAGALEQRRRFLAAAVRTLALFGVEARERIRCGTVEDEILAEIGSRGHHLVVVGEPLPRDEGGSVMSGITARLLRALDDVPVLVARSTAAVTRRGDR